MSETPITHSVIGVSEILQGFSPLQDCLDRIICDPIEAILLGDASQADDLHLLGKSPCAS
jgi:threonine aldolase